MPLAAYQYLPTTPPTPQLPQEIPGSSHSRNTSDSSVWSLDSSPASIRTDCTVPSPCQDSFTSAPKSQRTRSPVRIYGPTLLPRVRTQDLALPSVNTSASQHRRAASVASNRAATALRVQRPDIVRARTGTPEDSTLNTPLSAVSQYSIGFNAPLHSPNVTLTPSFRRRPGHTRATSTPNIDAATLSRYAFPHARLPTYTTSVPQCSPLATPYTPDFPQYASNLSYQTPIYEDVYQAIPANSNPYVIPDLTEPTTTLKAYLTSPNVVVHPIQQTTSIMGRGLQKHFWWDIRNVDTWDDFCLPAILQNLKRNLVVETGESTLPPPPPLSHSRLSPHSESALRDVIRDYYAAKVNRAMPFTQGPDRHLTMRAYNAPRPSMDSPHFISNYASDNLKISTGEPRAHIVGIVRSWDRWNTAMRRDTPVKRVEYLQALAQLHSHMRAHSCRYGFIMTEIELVCVRAGTEDTPYFGHLELSAPISLSAFDNGEDYDDEEDVENEDGPSSQQRQPMTACLALWYLHMLARDQTFEGTSPWHTNIGPACDMSRGKVMEAKDDWIPNPGTGERRTAKTQRGWALPEDPFNRKKEGGGTKRGR
ncbi:hypothetical protein MMC25_001146 [Agyrium rufum]|nr:hypothetical protein [Agyrium rufum]